MPTFELTSPDGKSYSVDGPAGTTPEQAYQMLQLSQLSDSQLQALHAQHGGADKPATPFDLSRLSDGELQALYAHASKPPFDPSQPYQAVGDLPPGFVLDQPKGPSVAGVAKAFGSGVGTGAADLLGGAGNVGSLIGSGVDYLGSQVGASPEGVQRFKTIAKAGLSYNPITGPIANMMQGPTSQDVQSGIERLTGPLYQPQNATEGYAKTAGEFLPMALGGEGSWLARAVRVAVPAFTSESAGQLTKGTKAEPYARAAGAIVGGAGSVAAERMLAGNAAKAAVPTAEDLLSTAGKQFNDANDMHMIVTGDVPQDIAATMRANLRREGFSPNGQKPVFDAIDELHALGESPAVAVNDMETIRKQLTKLKVNPDGAIREAAKQAIDDLNAGKASLNPNSVIRGDAQQYNGLIGDAVGNYAAGKRSNTVTGKVDLADLNAGTAGSGANVDNATRQAIKQLARPINNTNVPVARRLGFNNEETDAIRNAATGTALGNTARYIGKAAPTGIVSALMSSGAGHVVGGPVGAVALPTAGYIAKKIGDLSTKRAVAAVDNLVRSRSPLAGQVAAQLPPQVLNRLSPSTRALIQSLPVAVGYGAPKQAQGAI